MKVALYDIPDVRKFARAGVGELRHHILDGALTPDDWEELEAEGIAILYALAWNYEDHRKGYDSPGSFHGYAWSLLPLRLLDAFNRLHPERLGARRHPDNQS